ncbi:MAG: hypothetical protein KDD64_08615 [Bdellovibrionales bacterium]|nr:hypothetical protein [Bdellovibrionales bacterium]
MSASLRLRLRSVVDSCERISSIYRDFLLALPEEGSVSGQEVRSKYPSLRVGIQGGQGSFNEEALRSFFVPIDSLNLHLQYCYTTQGVLDYVTRGDEVLGQFAVFNSFGGVVEETERAMGSASVVPVALYSIPIRHFLLLPPEQKRGDLKMILAHPQVLKQCRGNLEKHFPQCQLRSGEGELIDTARLAKALIEKDPRVPRNSAVLGPKVLSTILPFSVSESSFEDSPDNRTWFLLVRRA